MVGLSISGLLYIFLKLLIVPKHPYTLNTDFYRHFKALSKASSIADSLMAN